MSKSLRNWDAKLSHAEFAYNRIPFYATSHSPVEACYTLNPLICLNCIPIPQESKVKFKVEKRGKEI